MEYQGGRGHHQGRVSAYRYILEGGWNANNPSRLDAAEIEEPCAHSVQYGGMCAECGKDMTEYVLRPSRMLMLSYTNQAPYRSSYVTNHLDVSRAQINMIHNNVALTVSQDEATKVEEEAKRRLIAAKKLSLVVDLDQTIIHATVDPTVAEWQKDPDNPNYGAVKDVRAFQLVDDGPGARGCWYYIKLRPGLKEFLDNVSKLYELHIYTMGTRAYAQNITNLIDPDRRIFGDRILSRDESGSLTAKNLQRLFPVDTKMVVIIDDRGDVWKWNENLIKVTPYDFFVGIGDINSSFLPKKPKIKITMKAEATTTSSPSKDLAPEATTAELEPQQSNDSTNAGSSKDTEAPATTADMSALEQLVSMGGGDNPAVLQAQTNNQDQALAAQLQDRPLLQKQKQLDAEDQAEAAKLQNGDGNPIATDSEKPHHNLLHDDDTELRYLERSLRTVHDEFFETYARQLADVQGGRLAELRGSQSSSKHKAPPNATLDLDLVPDIKTVMPSIKARVLNNVVIVFSGVVPLGTEIQSSDIALWAKSFGARIEDEVSSRRTTHLIAARNRTAKVRAAVRRGRGKIKIVNTKWLLDSVSQWKKLDETPYLLKTDDGEAGKPLPGEESEILSESEEFESAVATDTDATEDERGDRPMPGPRLTIKTTYATDDEDLNSVLPDDTLDAESPVGGTNEDWKEMHDEMAEFLGSDADDSDGDSVASDESGKNSVRSKKKSGKRSHDQMTGSSDENSQGNRKKLAITKSTNLTQSQVRDSGLPTPDITGGEEVEKRDTDDGWDEFEEDLEAEMERAANEDAVDG